jgi:hypothetical protein
MGDVMGQITAKRGHVLGMNSVDGTQHLRAQVPQAEMFHYATELRSITQGRGRFAQTLDHYAEVPHTIAEKVIAEHQAKATAPEREHRGRHSTRSGQVNARRGALADPDLVRDPRREHPVLVDLHLAIDPHAALAHEATADAS